MTPLAPGSFHPPGIILGGQGTSAPSGETQPGLLVEPWQAAADYCTRGTRAAVRGLSWDAECTFLRPHLSSITSQRSSSPGFPLREYRCVRWTLGSVPLAYWRDHLGQMTNPGLGFLTLRGWCRWVDDHQACDPVWSPRAVPPEPQGVAWESHTSHWVTMRHIQLYLRHL